MIRTSVVLLLKVLDFTWNCCRLQEVKKFSRKPGQSNCVARETRYHVSIVELLIQNLWNHVAGLVGRPSTILKIFYFSGGHQFFQISSGIKSLNDGGKNLIDLLAEEA